MIDYSPCKINIGLNITSKRDDGFHNIESIFYPIPLYDIIEIRKNSNNNFNYSQSGIIIDGRIESNLLFKAWQIIDNEYNIGGIDIHHHKRVPMQAGLGGGSANAATLLKMLNTEFNIGINSDKLHGFAAELGADCPFFIDNKPKFAFNIGTDFMDINLNLSKYTIIIVKPPVAVSTQEAYSGIKPQESTDRLQSLSLNNIHKWKNIAINSFEEHIFDLHPILKQIKQQLYSAGAIYASMSGSGSSIFGIFDSEIMNLDFDDDVFVWRGQLK